MIYISAKAISLYIHVSVSTITNYTCLHSYTYHIQQHGKVAEQMLSFWRGGIRGQRIAIKVPRLVRYKNVLVVVGELNRCGPLGENPVIINTTSNTIGLSNLGGGGPSG